VRGSNAPLRDEEEERGRQTIATGGRGEPGITALWRIIRRGKRSMVLRTLKTGKGERKDTLLKGKEESIDLATQDCVQQKLIAGKV